MSRPVVRKWTLNLSIGLDRNHKTPLWHQLANQLIHEIVRNRLVPGAALPGTRELASHLCINRKTVITAYDELVAQGWLNSDPKSGTFVSALPPEARQSKVRVKRPVERNDYVLNVEDTDIGVPLRGLPTKAFDDGLPDARLLPAEVLGRAYRSAVLSGSRNNLLQYDDPRGHPGLREAIAEMVNSERGLSVTRDNICITRGSQMAIFLASRVLAGPGQCIAMDALTYPPAYHIFKAMGANVVPVRLDHDGLSVDHLEELCRHYPIKSVYVTLRIPTKSPGYNGMMPPGIPG